jgi:hypothetical protein
VPRDGSFSGVQNRAQKWIKTEALALLGEPIKAAPKAQGTKGQLKGRGSSGGIKLHPPETHTPTLEEQGVDKRTANTARTLARLEPTGLSKTVLADRVSVILDQADRGLEIAVTIPEHVLLSNVAAAQEVFATRQRLGEGVIGHAHGIKIAALRDLGELIKVAPKNTGARGRGPGRGKGGSTVDPPLNAPLTLAEQGVDKKTANTARTLARLEPTGLSKDALRDAGIRRLHDLRQALEVIKLQPDVRQLKTIADYASAQVHWAAKQQLGEDVENHGFAIKTEALALLGDLIKTGPKAEGTRGQLKGQIEKGPGGSRKVLPGPAVAPTLASQGVDKRTANTARKLAELEPAELNAVIARDKTLAKVTRESKAVELHERIALPDAKFRVVYADRGRGPLPALRGVAGLAGSTGPIRGRRGRCAPSYAGIGSGLRHSRREARNSGSGRGDKWTGPSEQPAVGQSRSPRSLAVQTWGPEQRV